jgi:hypothetical protein
MIANAAKSGKKLYITPVKHCFSMHFVNERTRYEARTSFHNPSEARNSGTATNHSGSRDVVYMDPRNALLLCPKLSPNHRAGNGQVILWFLLAVG